jgi:large conductance mechanosensitive channel
MLKGFKEFIMKGNVVDMAVGVIMGVAFGNVVSAVVKDLVTPIIGAVGGTPDFSGIFFTVNNSKFMIGDLINVLISFFTISLVVYFGVIVPMNKLNEQMKNGKSPEPADKTCPECLSLIPAKARRCKFCTAELNI